MIVWNLFNIRKGVNDEILIDSVSTKIPEGYYTFDELAKYLKTTHSITITKQQDNKVILTSTKDLNLKYFGFLLGFELNKAITKTTPTTSSFPASMTNGLKEIRIYCPSLVDEYRNYSFSSTENVYTPSSLLIALNIDTRQILNGTITNFHLDSVRLPLANLNSQDVEFHVESAGHILDYEIYLTLEID